MNLRKIIKEELGDWVKDFEDSTIGLFNPNEYWGIFVGGEDIRECEDFLISLGLKPGWAEKFHRKYLFVRVGTNYSACLFLTGKGSGGMV